MAPGKKALGGKNAPGSFPPSALPEVASTPCLRPTSKTLVAGKKSLGGKTSSHTPSAPEEEDMDLSSMRDRNIMRNNQFAQRLGVRKLAELFQSSLANKKTARKSIGKKSKGKMWAAVCHHLVIIMCRTNVPKNQMNREKVQFQQRTGSRSYIAQAYIVKQEKYKDTEPTAIDLFKELHCSKTKGFSEPVKKAIDDMHAQEALTSPSVEDGQKAKTSIEVVSKVLLKSNTFLRNVGIQQPAPKTTDVMKELQAELDAKKLESAGLQEEFGRLKAHAQESDAKVDKQAVEIESLRTMAADTQSLIRQMIAFGQGQISPP